MPRIAYISSTFPDYEKCGTGIYAGYLTAALAEQGHEVHVVTSALPEIRPTYGKVTVHKIFEQWNALELPRLFQLFWKIKPDIIHINHPTLIAGAKSKILVNIIPEINRISWRYPLVTTLHEFGQVSLLGKLKILPMILASDAVTVTNQRYCQDLKKFLPDRHHGKIQAVNIGCQLRVGLPEGDRLEQRKKWGLEPDHKVIGFMGFITPPKGFHNLIESVAPLIRQDPQIRLLALSSWNQSTPAYRQKILDQIEREGISSQVIFTGFLKDDDLWAAMSSIDVCTFAFDHPVEQRSSGPLRQALYRGLPTVVYAENLDYSEFGLRHGENIWLTPFMDQNAFRDNVEKLLGDRELRSHLVRGTMALRPQLGFDSVSNSISRLYSGLLGSARK